MQESPILRVYEPVRPNFVFGAAMLTIAALQLAPSPVNPERGWNGVNAIIFSLLAFRFLRKAFYAYRSCSVLDLYDSGFACPGRFAGTIPWRDVAAYAESVPGASLWVRLHPDAADRVQWRGLEAFSRSVPGCRPAPIGVSVSFRPEGLLDAQTLMEARIEADRVTENAQNVPQRLPIRLSQKMLGSALKQWPTMILSVLLLFWVLVALFRAPPIITSPSAQLLLVLLASEILLFAIAGIAIYVRSTRGVENWRNGAAFHQWRAAYRRRLAPLLVAAGVIPPLSVVVFVLHVRNSTSSPSPLYPVQIDAGPLAGVVPKKVKTVPAH